MNQNAPAARRPATGHEVGNVPGTMIGALREGGLHLHPRSARRHGQATVLGASVGVVS